MGGRGGGGGHGGGHGAGGFFQEDEILGKAYDAALTQRLVGYLAPYKGWVVVAIVLLLLQSLAQIAPPILAKNIIDQAIVPAVNKTIGRDDALGRLALLGVAYLAILAAGAIALSMMNLAMTGGATSASESPRSTISAITTRPRYGRR